MSLESHCLHWFCQYRLTRETAGLCSVWRSGRLLYNPIISRPITRRHLCCNDQKCDRSCNQVWIFGFWRICVFLIQIRLHFVILATSTRRSAFLIFPDVQKGIWCKVFPRRPVYTIKSDWRARSSSRSFCFWLFGCASIVEKFWFKNSFFVTGHGLCFGLEDTGWVLFEPKNLEYV